MEIKKYFVLVSILIGCSVSAMYGGVMTEVNNFGSDPGNLRMFKYVPDNMPVNAPIVVAMHGCSQTSTSYEFDTEWNKLADQYKFYVVYPDQQIINNGTSCFNWFLLNDIKRNQGEARSIRSMVEYMQNNYSTDSTQVFCTGFSAGGSMVSVLCSVYPDFFSKGALIAGTPYKSATNVFEAAQLFSGININKTATAWGNLVRNAFPTYVGDYPKMLLMHGSNDIVVNPDLLNESMEQWTDVHGTDQTPELVETNYNGNNNVTKSTFENTAGDVVVESYFMQSLLHAIPVDPGNCFERGGNVNLFSQNFNFYSSYYIADFFGLIDEFEITTQDTCLLDNASGITFSVPEIEGREYAWSVPNDANITLDNGGDIVVEWGTMAGNVSVTEIVNDGCQRSTDVLIDICNIPTALQSSIISNFSISNLQSGYFQINGSSLPSKTSFKLYNFNGQMMLNQGIVSLPHQISINHLSSGSYVLVIENEGRFQAEKVVVLR